MRRIYYGSITLDVSDLVAEKVMALGTMAREAFHYRSEPAVGGGVMRPFWIGRTEVVRVSAYVNQTEELDVVLVVGTGMPLAIGLLDDDDRPDPAGTEASMEQLDKRLAEYLEADED